MEDRITENSGMKYYNKLDPLAPRRENIKKMDVNGEFLMSVAELRFPPHLRILTECII